MSMLTLLYCQPCGNVLVKDLITLKNVNADTTLLSTMRQRSSKGSNHSENANADTTLLSTMRQRSSKGSNHSENVNADTTLLSTMRQRSSKGSNHSEKCQC